MTWVKIDDKFYDNRANRELGAAGRDLFLAGLCYCNKGLTDGEIPKVDVPMLLAQAQAKKATIERLLAAGRWLDLGDRYEVAEYLEYQPSKAKVLAEREKARKKKQRQRAGQPDDDPFEDVPLGSPPGDTPRDSPGDSPPVVPVPPSRPVPSTPNLRPPGASVLVNGDREAAFAAFWSCYPKKVAKATARAAFGKALKRTTAETIVAGAQSYRDDPERDPDFTKHPATWLNGDCWDDEREQERRRSKAANAADRFEERHGHIGAGHVIEVRELNP